MKQVSESSESPTSRREFLKRASITTAGGILAAPAILPSRGYAAGAETLKVGLIGCGGRGTGAASQALQADPNVVLWAMGDAFEDRLSSSLNSLQKQFADLVKVTPERQYVGFEAYRKVIDSGVDVVLLATPPGFRPIHLEYAIGQGKHVFCEKPMAVDAPGVRKVLAVAEEARRRRLSLVAGFCWRYNAGERALMERVHGGAIGEPMALHTVYDTGSLWVHPRQPGWSDMTYQMRNWYYFAWLSGDHIMEQACHSLDKMAWAMQDVPPVQCVGLGGRQVRTGEDFGHIFDHFAVVYEYANGARGFHNCRQQAGCANDNSDYFIGTKGVATIKAFGPLAITGETKWRFRGERPNMYQVEHNELFASIRKAEPINDGKWMAQSTLLALMGRMASYTGQVVTWDQALHSEENLMGWVTGQDAEAAAIKLDWNMPLRVPPVALPGITSLA